jgi:hypothetical protein
LLAFSACSEDPAGLRLVVDPEYRLLRLDLPPPEAAGQALSSPPAWGRAGPRAFGLPPEPEPPAPRDRRPAPVLDAARVELTLRPDERNLSGRIALTVRPEGTELSSLRLALSAQAVDAVSSATPAVSHTYRDGLLTLTPATPIPAGQPWAVEIAWHDGEVEHYQDAFEEGGGRVLANLLAPHCCFFTYGHHYFPDPLDVAVPGPWTFQVTFPADRTLLLPGERTDAQTPGDGTRTETWLVERPRRASVMLALARYERVEAACGPVALELYAIPGRSIDDFPIRPEVFGPVLGALCDHLRARLGEPVRARVRVAGVDERFTAGRSAPGFILVPNYTFDDDGTGSFPEREFYLAHEFSHQWLTGGRVAAARDGWLVEGSADWVAIDAVEALRGPEAARRLWLWEVVPLLGLYRAGQPEHPLVPPPGAAVDPRITYVKGAWTLRMLEDAASPELVRAALRALVDGTLVPPIRTEDFTALVDSLAGQELAWFHEQWLAGLGLLELESRAERTSTEIRARLTQLRAWSPSPPRFFRAPLTLRAEDQGRRQERTFELTREEETFSLPLP